MRKIDGYALTLAAILGAPYVLAPLVKEEFNASDAPDAPPLASIVMATTSGSATTLYDTISDEQIDMSAIFTDTVAPKRKPA